MTIRTPKESEGSRLGRNRRPGSRSRKGQQAHYGRSAEVQMLAGAALEPCEAFSCFLRISWDITRAWSSFCLEFWNYLKSLKYLAKWV